MLQQEAPCHPSSAPAPAISTTHTRQFSSTAALLRPSELGHPRPGLGPHPVALPRDVVARGPELVVVSPHLGPQEAGHLHRLGLAVQDQQLGRLHLTKLPCLNPGDFVTRHEETFIVYFVKVVRTIETSICIFDPGCRWLLINRLLSFWLLVHNIARHHRNSLCRRVVAEVRGAEAAAPRPRPRPADVPRHAAGGGG